MQSGKDGAGGMEREEEACWGWEIHGSGGETGSLPNSCQVDQRGDHIRRQDCRQSCGRSRTLVCIHEIGALSV
jgi:hypothetical protein